MPKLTDKTKLELLAYHQHKMLAFRKRNGMEGGKFYRTTKRRVKELKAEIEQEKQEEQQKRLKTYNSFLGI